MMNNFLLPGLQDLCVSRTSFKWGIPVDFDEKVYQVVHIDGVPPGFSHLSPAHQQPGMAKHLPGQRLSQSHQKDRPVDRTVSMSNKYFEGVVSHKGAEEPLDQELKADVLSCPTIFSAVSGRKGCSREAPMQRLSTRL